MKKKSLIGFIITTILCALFIFSSGCFDSGDSRSRELDVDPPLEKLQLKIDDGKTNLGSDGSAFAVGDIFVKLEQTGGDPIDWSKYTIRCENTETDETADLVIINCNGAPYDLNSNFQTEVGQTIELGINIAGDFESGDRVEVTVFNEKDLVFKSQGMRVA